VEEGLGSNAGWLFPMDDFANPWVLPLLAVVPLLAWRWLRRPRAALDYPDTAGLEHLPPGRARAARWGGAALRAAWLSLLVVALAGPRWPDFRSRVATEGVAVQMVVDTSGSMAEPDFTWDGKPATRLDAVKKVFQLFVAGGTAPDGELLQGRPDDLVGLVTFARWPESPCPLTLSHSVLLEMLDAQKPHTLPSEAQTNVGDAIAWGLHRLAAAPKARKVMILLSDGEHNVPPPALTPRQAAQLAASQHVPVYCIDAGGDTAAGEVPDSDRPDSSAGQIRASAERWLKAVAQVTGGKYFRAGDTTALLAVCREIDRLERNEIQSFVYRRYTEFYPWVALAALCLWGVTQLLERTVWLRLP
jgi:Ca-activated chloride channel family protein